MCEYCENGHVTGGSLSPEEVGESCAANVAECLRDTIRNVAFSTTSMVALDELGDEIDRYINALVSRIQGRPEPRPT